MAVLCDTIVELAAANNKIHSAFMPIPGTQREGDDKLVIAVAFDEVQKIIEKFPAPLDSDGKIRYNGLHGVGSAVRTQFYSDSKVCIPNYITTLIRK